MEIRCPYCIKDSGSAQVRTNFVYAGHFIRKVDGSKHQRFLCKQCRKSFSTASFEPCFKQKKRHLNPDIYKFLVSGVSQRRLALLLNTNRKTVVRKFLFLGIVSHHVLTWDNKQYPLVSSVEFDDLETFEHSKLKPLSVTMAVESKTRRILGYRVARMPAKGLLVAKSLKKYGPRKDERAQKREQLFSELKTQVCATAIVKSDQNPHYIESVRKYFPQCVHKTYKGRRGCVVGQGELKSGGYDPIFSLNHTFAMKRANINRLFRRTWNTTKKPERLDLHIAMYVLFHNKVLI